MSRQRIRQRAGRFSESVRWVASVAWKAGAALFVGVLVCQLVASALPVGLAWVGRGIINSLVELTKAPENDVAEVMPWLFAGCCLMVVSELLELVRSLAQRALDE